MNKHQEKRKRLEIENGGSFSDIDWDDMKWAFDYRCVKCGAKETKKEKLHADHVIPLTRGGSSDIRNIQPLCRSCNCSKGNREAVDYRPTFFVNHMGKFPVEKRASLVKIRTRALCRMLCLKYALNEITVYGAIETWGLSREYKEIAIAEGRRWLED